MAAYETSERPDPDDVGVGTMIYDTDLGLLEGSDEIETKLELARAYLDTRVTTIYAGTTEIMKEIIGRAVVAGTYKAR